MYIQFLLVMSAFRISKWSFQTRSKAQRRLARSKTLAHSRQLPSLPIFAADVARRFGAILRLEPGGVPLNAFARAISDVAQVVGFGQRAGVIEVAGRGLAGLAGFDPFFPMADGIRDERLGLLEVGELVLRQQAG